MAGAAITDAGIEARPRRTQAQRRNATRSSLLDATVQSLVDLGYSRTTTTEVCARAGVSQGALFRYFPTKQALLAAAVEHLYDQLLHDFEEEARPLKRGAVGSNAALEALWRTFQRRELAAAYELHVAARTDPELREQLQLVTMAHGSAVRETAASLFSITGDRFASVLDTVLEAFQGIAISRMVQPDPDHEKRVFEVLRALAREAFEETGAI